MSAPIWEDETPLLSAKTIKAMLDRELGRLAEEDVLGHQMLMFIGQRLGEQLGYQRSLIEDGDYYPPTKAEKG